MPKFAVKMQSEQQIYSVSRLNAQIKQVLENQFSSIWLEGEVSNLMKAASGHWYFSLKDKNAQIKCAMFKGANRRVALAIDNGMQVLVRANASLYAPRGDCQLIVESMQAAGLGQLQQAYEALKDKLQQAGLFAQERKKALPENIQRVALVTSSKGAAIQDILSILKRRAQHIQIDVYPSLVQGSEATADLVNKLQLADQNPAVDVIILGRGGGSLEDLWCFNEEALALQIAQCQHPVISAVGHESDITISDLVADIRAATPSAGAEIVSQNSLNWRAVLPYLGDRLNQAIQFRQQHYASQLKEINYRLTSQSPLQKVRQQAQRVDEIHFLLQQKMQQKITRITAKQHALNNRILNQNPQVKIEKTRARIMMFEDILTHNIQERIAQQQHQLKLHASNLHAYSPLNTLSRGYSLTFDEAGKVVQQADELKPGQEITTRFANSQVVSEVKNVSVNSSRSSDA
ncbi:exodeoxyribonuclease VII large subunit [Gayadomonas joobiniege]|uniref:exodeoxyribonuclease VII large subunit n=1 Tax=Gayadomonas joobiniege TaxID=1234606 RepID=UPI000366898F|nr:exodeoxyribonuclease VII large subunit [Gayadomonas joobiniege]